jgi:DNA uptake protein ComE-like DNA-binding protein
LLELKGIGPAFAGRIIKYRNKLGGFYSVSQLKEVWGINDTVFNKFAGSVYCSDTIPEKFIYLNTDSFSVISSHPYLKGKQASFICNYRKQHPFTSVEELKNIPLITDENFRKLAPYLRLE